MKCPSCDLETRPGGEECASCGTALSFGDGRFMLRTLLAEGSRKRVYTAYDSRLGRDAVVAVPRLSTATASRPWSDSPDVQTRSGLGRHPHILEVFDFDLGHDGGRPYVASEYAPGGDLEVRLERSPEHRLPLVDALGIAIDVCAALEHAHEQRIVHHRVSPGNVWLTADGRAKLG